MQALRPQKLGADAVRSLWGPSSSSASVELEEKHRVPVSREHSLDQLNKRAVATQALIHERKRGQMLTIADIRQAMQTDLECFNEYYQVLQPADQVLYEQECSLLASLDEALENGSHKQVQGLVSGLKELRKQRWGFGFPRGDNAEELQKLEQLITTAKTLAPEPHERVDDKMWVASKTIGDLQKLIVDVESRLLKFLEQVARFVELSKTGRKNPLLGFRALTYGLVQLDRFPDQKFRVNQPVRQDTEVKGRVSQTEGYMRTDMINEHFRARRSLLWQALFLHGDVREARDCLEKVKAVAEIDR